MKLSVKDLVILSMLGPLLFVGDIGLEMLPNIHLVGVLVVVITAVYRSWALYPLYIYVFLSGLYGGFALWWLPYLYIWTLLWGAVMLLPQKPSPKIRVGLYIGVCAVHGYLFGTLYAPAQALLFGLDWKGMLSWIAAGLPFDLIHGTSNIFCGLLLIPPLYTLLQKLKHTSRV